MALRVGMAAGHETKPNAKGVFFGYDFHLNEQGVHLIEINTNAGGAFLNELLINSQRDADLPGKTVAIEHLDQSFLAMFRNEWRLERGSAPLRNIAIVDEKPEEQYLYPEFLLAQTMLERAGIAVYIADPVSLLEREDGLYFGYEKIDMVYNRLTDFSLQQYPALLHSIFERTGGADTASARLREIRGQAQSGAADRCAWFARSGCERGRHRDAASRRAAYLWCVTARDGGDAVDRRAKIYSSNPTADMAARARIAAKN